MLRLSSFGFLLTNVSCTSFLRIARLAAIGRFALACWYKLADYSNELPDEHVHSIDELLILLSTYTYWQDDP
jgi:hypothetical protein